MLQSIHKSNLWSRNSSNKTHLLIQTRHSTNTPYANGAKLLILFPVNLCKKYHARSRHHPYQTPCSSCDQTQVWVIGIASWRKNADSTQAGLKGCQWLQARPLGPRNQPTTVENPILGDVQLTFASTPLWSRQFLFRSCVRMLSAYSHVSKGTSASQSTDSPELLLESVSSIVCSLKDGQTISSISISIYNSVQPTRSVVDHIVHSSQTQFMKIRRSSRIRIPLRCFKQRHAQPTHTYSVILHRPRVHDTALGWWVLLSWRTDCLSVCCLSVCRSVVV